MTIAVLLLSTACKSENTINMETDNVPDLFGDIGTSYRTLVEEHPAAIIYTQNDGLPDAAAVSLYDPDMEYSYFLFGTQYFLFEDLSEPEKAELKCAGIVTTVGALFSLNGDKMEIADFFSSQGISDYRYYTEDADSTLQGWITFSYRNMNGLMNTNSGDTVTEQPVTAIKGTYPVLIISNHIEKQNLDIIDAHEQERFVNIEGE
ncbi:MAG: hypothetical protein LIO58_01315 [Oscillospiraceae bacterium]|nr:hypothetical protein [Oscillospiraceae bacterium]